MIKKNNLNSQQEIENNLDLVKNYLNTKNLDYFDVRLEKNKTNKIIIENKNTKTISNIETIGIGIRIIKNKKMGFCSTNNISNYKKIIDDCIENTKKISVKTNFDHEAENNKKIKYKHESFDKKEISRKVLELQKINHDFLSEKSAFKIAQSNITYFEKHTEKYFVNPNSFIYQEQPRIIFYSSITGKKNNLIETHTTRIGEIGGLEKINSKKIEETLLKNKQKVNDLLNSKPCPATKTDIILTPELVDLLAHEAIGHSAEGDGIVNHSSVLKIGQVLSENPLINVIDNPTLKTEFGSFVFDDEGILARPKTIIKKGIVNEYLLDIESASKLGFKSNGSARAESYSSKPIVRMSNTYFTEGKDKYDEMLSDFSGYLLDGFAGGQVDPSVGTFMFGIKFAYKYDHGKLIEKYKQASISGNILTYLKNISRISNKIGKFEFGFCGKDGQMAYVSGSGPNILVKNAVVGGTKHEWYLWSL